MRKLNLLRSIIVFTTLVPTLLLSGMSMGAGLVHAAPGVNFVYTASLDAKQDVCNGIGEATGGSCSGGSGGISSLLKTIIELLSWVVGAVSVIMIIIGGLRYVTSGGNDQNLASAKNTVIYALIGLVIVALAQIIVEFVFTKAIKSS
jgi:type IV secretion system pilin